MPIVKSTRSCNLSLWSDSKIADEIIKLEARLKRLYQERSERVGNETLRNPSCWRDASECHRSTDRRHSVD